MSNSNYDLKPSKEAYRAIKSDVTPVSAIKELVDNALDNWQRTTQQLDDINISIEHRETKDGEQIHITDNSGGVPEDDVSMLFALGQSAKDDITGSIGAYGIGAKKAIVNLGDRATIKSRALHTEQGFGFTIDQDWLEDEGDWTVDKQKYDDIDEGVTEIIISDLNTTWSDIKSDLETDLESTYRLFLSDDRLTDIGDLGIRVNDTKITTPEDTNWSYTPIDGFHPRRYENIEIESRDLTNTVYLDVQVGLLEEADNSVAGAEIYCQNRQILDRVRDERAGFNTGAGSSRLGRFTGQHRRLKVEIEFYTEGNASELPWDAQKSDIDRYHKVTQAAHDWIRRIVKPYREAAGDYDDFPTTFSGPYTEDHEHGRGLEVFNYSDRERVTHKPDTDFPGAAEIQSQVEKTIPLRLRCTDDLSAEQVGAYEEELERRLGEDANFDVAIENVPEIDKLPQLSNIDTDAVEQQLAEQAERNVDAGRYITGLDDWQQAMYRWQVLKLIHDRDDLNTIRDLEKKTNGELESESKKEEDLDKEFGVSIDTVSEDTAEEDSHFRDGNNTDVATENEEPAELDKSEEEPTRSFTDFEQTADNDESSQDILGGIDSDDESDRQVEVTENTLYIPIPDDRSDELFEALGIDDDADEEEIADKLLEKMNFIRQLQA